MALKGDLASVDLAQVFQMLALNQKVGMLCISSPKGWRALYFEPRGASLYFDEHVMLDKVVLQATRQGHLAPEDITEARSHAAAHGMGLADALIAGGYLTDSDLTVLLRSEMEEEIYDLFFWTEACFEFFEGATSIEGRQGHVDSRFVFSTDTLIMEAARRIDEWSFIQERIAGPLEVFRPVGNASNILDMEDSALALYDLVDGKRNVSRLIETTGLPAFLVYKGLAVLLEDGLVEAVLGDDLLQTAADCEQEGRLQDAINLYERAVSLGEGIPDSHARAAAVYETLLEFELACYHNKCVAEYWSRADDTRSAVDILKHVVDLLPTDLAARERLVELTVGRADLATKEFDPVANGKELVDLYLEIGEVERVRGILERLLRDNPFDIELKKSLINVHSKAGDSKRVVELYESIAEDLVQDRKPIEAVKYLQKILMIDRNRKDISERIRSLYVLDERRRNRRRSMVALAALGVVLVALGTGWWFYDQHARERFLTVETRVEKLLAGQDYRNAIDEWRALLDQVQFTLVARDVEVELSRIESLELKHQEELEQERLRFEEGLSRLRQRYQARWSLVESQVGVDDLDGALASVEEVSRMVEEAGQIEDMEWAREVGLEKNLTRLRTYIAKAFELDRKARGAMRAGDWRAARGFWLELVREHGMAAHAQAVRLPVQITSRPAGAMLMRNSEPYVQEGGEPLRTPCVVLCGHTGAVTFKLQLEGFALRRFSVDAVEQDSVDLVLEAVPAAIITFEEPVRGDLVASRGYVGVGLRGGRIALVRIDGGTQIVHRLPGLDDVDGEISLTAASAIFATREGSVIALSLATGDVSWSIRPRSRPDRGLLVLNNRLLFVDQRSRLVAYDASKGGTPLWFLPLGDAVGGPTAAGRDLVVSLVDGEILKLDGLDGSVLARVATGATLATKAVDAGAAVLVGTADGRVLAVRMDAGRVAWEHELVDGGLAEQIVVVGDSVLIRSTEHRLVKLGLRDGKVEASITATGRIVSGPEVSDGRVLIVVRPSDQAEDVLVAHRMDDLRMLWEYRDGGQFTSGVSTHGSDIFLAGSKGEVLRFR